MMEQIRGLHLRVDRGANSAKVRRMMDSERGTLGADGHWILVNKLFTFKAL
jgi:hypothetical protein